MTNDELRKSICSQLKEVDRTTLKMIQAMLQTYHTPATIEDEKELLRELKRISKARASGASPSIAAEAAFEYVRKNRKPTRK
jgi:hypothetical protein